MTIAYGHENAGLHSPPATKSPAADTRPAGGGRRLETSLTDSLDRILRLEKPELVRLLWGTDRKIRRLLQSSGSLHEARNRMFEYLNELERHFFNIYSDKKFKDLHDQQKKHAKWCIRVLKNILRTENEKQSGASALSGLLHLASSGPDGWERTGKGFICEMLFLFQGINGRFRFYRDEPGRKLEPGSGERPGLVRSQSLDRYGQRVRSFTSRYRSGLEPGIIERNAQMASRIREYFEASERDWADHHWQLNHIVDRLADLENLVELSDEERRALALAEKHDLTFQITPYYLSLLQPLADAGEAAVIRAQVLPNLRYVEGMLRARESGTNLDFMGEASTSPVDGVTRRYVHVLILKAFNSCPQICVYCQRNWELTGLDQSCVPREQLEQSIGWVEANENIQEVLVTGGDPLTLEDSDLEWLLGRLASIDHLERIRVSTRVPVTLPMRITPHLVDLLARHHDFGRREVCVVTHYESPLEMTPDSLAAIRRIRAAGINVYNQQVFTYFNSKKFQTFHLRRVLKRSGVDPYYCFNTKGKEETADFRVPIARLLQEWAEEARLLPGLARTDTPVFNVPTLGKSYLQSWQDHEVIMILPDGRRVYRFYPWESMLSETRAYVYTDVSIHAYLMRLLADGERVDDYHTIWCYF